MKNTGSDSEESNKGFAFGAGGRPSDLKASSSYRSYGKDKDYRTENVTSRLSSEQLSNKKTDKEIPIENPTS